MVDGSAAGTPQETPFERLETAWADVLTAWGHRVVADSRGVPTDDDPYPSMRRAFGAALRAFPRTGLSDAEAAGLATIESALEYIDDTLTVEGLDRGPDAGGEIDALRRATYEAFGEAAANLRIDGRTMDRLSAFRVQATASDPARRRAAFEAMRPMWQAVDGDGGPDSPYRQSLRASVARWERVGSVIDSNAAGLGIAPADFEPMLERILVAGRRALVGVAGEAPIEPWDYRYLVGEAERRLAETVPVGRLQPINVAHLRALGADPQTLGIDYDVLPRPGRPVIPVAFTIGVGVPARPHVFATYESGGLGELAELLHESGHAIHYAAIRTRPCFAEPPAEQAAFFEAIGDLVGWDASEPAFQARHLGTAVEPAVARLDRYGAVLLDVCWALLEIELHRSPDRRPNDVWTEITRDGLGIAAHPEWSWWAVRGQLIELPGYMANYALAAIAVAALRARVRALRGDWSTGDPGWYPFVAERLLRFGGERRPAEVLAAFLGGPPTAEPLLADLGGGVR
jgi:hypothetical protein